jgi:hypothetical protein
MRANPNPKNPFLARLSKNAIIDSHPRWPAYSYFFSGGAMDDEDQSQVA